MIVNSFPDCTIAINNHNYLYFGGTSYLGMATLSKFQKLLFKGIKQWGMFYGSSRNSNIKLSVYKNAEALFSKQIGTKDALAVTSGTLAGKLVIEYLSKCGNTFYHIPKTHPAILKDGSLPVFINGKLNQNLLNNVSEDIVISADAILALEVNQTSFGFLDKISKQKRVTLIVDESHSLGILGQQGNGIFKEIFNKNLHRKIMVSSLGKALGLSGGIIASDSAFIDAIKNETLFISSSGASPAYLEAFIASQHLYKTQLNKLKDNLTFLSKGLTLKSTFKFNKNYPVIYCYDNNAYAKLFERGIVITNFKYPNYKGYMNRIVITANHTFDDLKRLQDAINGL